MNITDGIAASQRGLVTSAQALSAGVGRMELSRLAANGHLERVCRGVYRASGAPSIREEAVWAAWLSLEPAVPAHSRDPLACAASHSTAAQMKDLVDIVLMARTQELAWRDLRVAVAAECARRKMDVPVRFEAPAFWKSGFGRFAHRQGVDITFEEACGIASALFDPVLACDRCDAWNLAELRWDGR